MQNFRTYTALALAGTIPFIAGSGAAVAGP